MGITDLIELAAELIPSHARRGLVLLLAIGLVLGPARPAFNAAVTWFVETKAREISQDVTPIVQQMLATAAVPPTATTRP
ncbi:MAG TPA: hypothetical protein VGC04_02720 [Cellulomonas sp.]